MKNTHTPTQEENKGKNNNNKVIKKWKRVIWIITTVVICIILFFGIPLIINQLYMLNRGIVTLWGAEDVLSFYSVLLSGGITIGVFIVTLKSNNKDLEKMINGYLARDQAPFFSINKIQIKSKNQINDFEYKDIWNKKLMLDRSNSIYNGFDTISFDVQNIGEGSALVFQCCVLNNRTSSNYNLLFKQTVKKNEIFVIEYGIKNIIKEMIENGKEFVIIVFSLEYSNTSGIKFEQHMQIKINLSVENKSVLIEIEDISFRKAMLDEV